MSGAIINTWLFNKTGGSVLINMLLHASVDLMVGVFNPLFAGPDSASYGTWQMVVFIAVAVLITVLTGRELGRKPEPAVDMLAAD
jgi:hypothetical protein